jgi:predicted SnoaL-like aldol condensation-catalyzing enzyme
MPATSPGADHHSRPELSTFDHIWVRILLRLEDGKIVEHWDNAEPIEPEEEWVNSGKF